MKTRLNFKQNNLISSLREQKEVTKMMDNLYLDKLKGRITESAYDKFYQKFRDQITDISIQIRAITRSRRSLLYYRKYLLELTTRAYDLFMSSEVEEKRQLIKLVLSNLR